MSYISPFYLLPEHEVATFKLTDLNVWKTQLLTRLEQTQLAAITINERKYTQKDVVDAFDLLKDAPEFHWRLFQNKPLLAFIEQGHLDFFKQEKSREIIWDTFFCDWLEKWFVPQYDDTLHRIAQNIPESVAAIQTLKASNFQLPQSWHEAATRKIRQFFNDFLENANTRINDRDTVVEGRKLSLKPDIRPYIDYNYVELLQVLPDSFKDIKNQYGAFAHRVVDGVLPKSHKLKNIEAGTVGILREAAKIDVAVHDNQYSKDFLAQVGETERLYRPGQANRQKKKSNLAYFVLIPLVLVVLGLSYFGVLAYKAYQKLTLEENRREINYIKDERKLDVLGEWQTEAKAEEFVMEKKLAFTSEAAGVMNIVIADSVNNNTCELNADFTWTLVRGEISIYYDDIQLKKDFKEGTEKGIVNSKDLIMEMKAEALKVDTFRTDAASSPIFILTKGNSTYIRTGRTGWEDLDTTDIEKMKFLGQTALIISRFRQSDYTGSFVLNREKDGDWYGVYADEKVNIASGKMKGNTYYIAPRQWITKQSGYSYAGTLEDVYFIDEDSKPRFGHLRIYFSLVDGLDVRFQVTKNRPKIRERKADKPSLPAAKYANPDREISETPDKLPKMLDIPAGTFTMGCTSGDTNCSKDEKPAHQVTLAAFQMSRYEITNAQYCEFLNEKEKHRGAYLWIDIDHKDAHIKFRNGKYIPKYSISNHRPVVKVTWHGANTYCRWLSKKTGKKYILPTEAQWEYAARGGQDHIYAGSDNINHVAAYTKNTRSASDVNSKRMPNGYGLHDMSGNVWEWCADWYGETHYANKKSAEKGPKSGAKRVLRGGSWREEAVSCRVSHRSWYYPVYSSHNVGFRCVVNLE